MTFLSCLLEISHFSSSFVSLFRNFATVLRSIKPRNFLMYKTKSWAPEKFLKVTKFQSFRKIRPVFFFLKLETTLKEIISQTKVFLLLISFFSISCQVNLFSHLTYFTEKNTKNYSPENWKSVNWWAKYLLTVLN